jgi:hypothetical protein
MNDGVALLLERMETHPDEFFDFGSKWASLIGDHKDFLEVEDRQALTDGLNKLMQQRFTEKVLEKLIDPKKSDDWVDSVMQAKNYPNKIPTMPLIKSVPFSMTEHIEAHEKFIGQTPIAGVTQTL